MIHVKEYETRKEWLSARGELDTFGSSALSALFGANPFYSDLAAIADRITGEDSRDTEQTSWGLDLEETIAKRLAREHGLTFCRIVSKPYAIYLNDDFPHLHCSPDFLVTNGGKRTSNFQIKNVGRRVAHHWDNGPPDYVIVQVQGELAAEGLDHSYVGAQIAGDPPAIFEVKANEKFQRAIRKLTDECWQLVVERRLPEVSTVAMASTRQALKALHPDDNGEEVELGPEYDAFWQTMQCAKEERDRAQATIDFVDAQFRKGIGEATFGRTLCGRWSLKTTTTKPYEVGEKTYRTLRKVRQ